MLAAESGHPGAVHVLLAAAADLSVRLANGWTAFMFAAAAGQVASLEALLTAGADLHATRPRVGLPCPAPPPAHPSRAASR